jgi:hypothetical protein
MTRLFLSVPALAMLHALGSCGPVVPQQATPSSAPSRSSTTLRARPLSLASAPIDQAQAAAPARYPGATVSEVDLVDEEAVLVSEVDLWSEGRETEVTVDAGTSGVLQDRD